MSRLLPISNQRSPGQCLDRPRHLADIGEGETVVLVVRDGEESLRRAQPESVVREGVAGGEDRVKGEEVTGSTGNFTPAEIEGQPQGNGFGECTPN